MRPDIGAIEARYDAPWGCGNCAAKRHDDGRLVHASTCGVDDVFALLAHVRALEAERDELRAALRAIVDANPEWRPVPGDLKAAIEACPECAACRKREWPPSRLCDDHYRAMDRHHAENTHREHTHAFVLRNIARLALNPPETTR